MIKATFHINSDTDVITQVSVNGHAGYDVFGQDIICASVSSLLIATLNGLEEYVGIDTEVELEHGATRFCIKPNTEVQKIQAQALAHSFYLAMVGLSDENEDFIEINIMEDKDD